MIGTSSTTRQSTLITSCPTLSRSLFLFSHLSCNLAGIAAPAEAFGRYLLHRFPSVDAFTDPPSLTVSHRDVDQS